ncbi:uncharacterized protein LOC141672307 isoform X2 [Apium graveolens]|uniref:uncharacterized protein LOC141672307 isoform X2 n=1 Tax=Apium graveolens TaxID=4045 RepID=UPI003D7B7F10
MSLMMANQGGNTNNNVILREYRKGNWTVQETMVLIEAKKMDEERRMKKIQGESSSNEAVRNLNKPAELRWKWVEDFCWRNGCLRSQNQCNDKWDNLMRDFKKVRDFERRMTDNKGDNFEFGGQFSYWKMDKIMRKEKHLPSNLLPQIYEALVDVVEKKGQRFFTSAGGGASSTNPNIVTTNVLGQHVDRPIACTTIVQPVVSLLPHLQHHISSLALPLPPPPQLPQPSQPSPPLPESYPCPQPLTISDSQTSGQSNSSAKRRRRGEETSNAAAAATSNANHEVGSAISRSASLIAGAIQANEEREERRHRELLNLHEKRLQIEESKAEINRQGISGMVDAINKLAHSVLALAANKKPPNS